MGERDFNAFDVSAVVSLADRRPVKLLPCPFCEGPPVPIVQNNTASRGAAPLQDDYGDDGLDARAFVFCHECGCESPDVTGTIYSRMDYAAIERMAVNLWQKRDARHRACYDGGEAERLNWYPMPAEASKP